MRVFFHYFMRQCRMESIMLNKAQLSLLNKLPYRLRDKDYKDNRYKYRDNYI